MDSKKQALHLSPSESHKALHHYYRIEWNEKKKQEGPIVCLDHYLNSGARESTTCDRCETRFTNFRAEAMSNTYMFNTIEARLVRQMRKGKID